MQIIIIQIILLMFYFTNPKMNNGNIFPDQLFKTEITQLIQDKLNSLEKKPKD